jgi:hypothetical protein
VRDGTSESFEPCERKTTGGEIKQTELQTPRAMRNHRTHPNSTKGLTCLYDAARAPVNINFQEDPDKDELNHMFGSCLSSDPNSWMT